MYFITYTLQYSTVQYIYDHATEDISLLKKV
jgi:hypothetical protein